jgi:hypothetical protein
MCPWVVRVLLPKLPFSVQFPILSNLIGIVVIVMFSAAVALATFCWVEFPFLKLRKAVLGRYTDHLLACAPIVQEPQVSELV